MQPALSTLLSLLSALSLASASAEQACAKHIRYQKIAAQPAIRQVLDVHFRAGDTTAKKPVIVWIHGGAWKLGSKSHSIEKKAKAFTDAGFVLVAINYRFHPQASWKDQALDVAAACQWVTGNISRYGGDPGRLILMGHSAGAHLAALTGADPSFLAARQVPRSSLRAVVLLDGAGYDLPAVMKNSRGRHLKLYREIFGNDPAQLKAASPIHHFKKGRACPAYLIIPVASRDMTVRQSKNLAARIRETGGIATVSIAKDRNHMSLNQKIGQPGDVPTQAILHFLSNQLHHDGKN